ncbi:FAD-binding oxidoreductase [Microbacterium album]|uniref:4-cresol dehydrogenase n=1 Tax=Microbacterium album TaxID=2053191 RepID=A0A917MN52_9MICO|nr:FAD-binding oxidoreductase [Microbacterium album]GGH48361.1 4-cresol dehydrogenase [Microbacterium album]
MTISDTHPIDADTLDTAIQRFRAVVGAEHVHTEGPAFDEFRDPFEPRQWNAYLPSVVVQPDSTEQVQQIVRIAGELDVPLWTNGQGRNNGYGGAAPRVTGSVLLNLRRFNRILEIDDELAYAVVEPGVSWLELYTALREGGHDLTLSVPDIGWGSVIGNSLDHGVTYMQYGEDYQAPCGLEVVLADGSLLRTGMGAQEGNPTWHLYKKGLGPGLDHLFMQSNFGVVTRMGVWLQRRPEFVLPAHVIGETEESIIGMVDVLRELKLDRTIEGVPCIFRGLNAAGMVSRRKDWYSGEGRVPDELVDRIGRELGVGQWFLRLGMWGDGPVLDHKYAKVKAAFEAVPGVRVESVGKLTPAEAEELEHGSDRVITGVANLDLARISNWNGGEGGDTGGHIDFSPVLPLTGRATWDLIQQVKPIQEAAGFDFSLVVMAISARAALFVCGSKFNWTDLEETQRAYDTARTLIVEAGKKGYAAYRAHLDFMDLAAEQLDFGDHAYLRFAETIKDAVDPQGILSPGKQGIWPRRLREGR